jgi:Flp pilus assembly protein TadG
MKKPAKQTRGQSLIEFALVFPMLLILMVGIMEFSRAWMTKNILTGAARETARWYVSDNTAGAMTTAIARGRTVLDSANLTTAPDPVITDFGASKLVEASATYNFTVIVAGFVPGLNNTSFQLSSTTTMRREW